MKKNEKNRICANIGNKIYEKKTMSTMTGEIDDDDDDDDNEDSDDDDDDDDDDI